MKYLNHLPVALLALLVMFCSGGMTLAAPYALEASAPFVANTLPDFSSFAAAPRWWEDAVQWVRSLGWDRSRLVQIWLFFMLIGLYIILRIKPRA